MFVRDAQHIRRGLSGTAERTASYAQLRTYETVRTLCVCLLTPQCRQKDQLALPLASLLIKTSSLPEPAGSAESIRRGCFCYERAKGATKALRLVEHAWQVGWACGMSRWLGGLHVMS